MKHTNRRLLTALSLLLVLFQAVGAHAGEETWTTDSLRGFDVRSIIVDPQSPARLYAFAPGVSIASVDGGTEWAPSGALPLGGLTPGQFEIDPLTPGIF